MNGPGLLALLRTGVFVTCYLVLPCLRHTCPFLFSFTFAWLSDLPWPRYLPRFSRLFAFWTGFFACCSLIVTQPSKAPSLLAPPSCPPCHRLVPLRIRSPTSSRKVAGVSSLLQVAPCTYSRKKYINNCIQYVFIMLAFSFTHSRENASHPHLWSFSHPREKVSWKRRK